VPLGPREGRLPQRRPAADDLARVPAGVLRSHLGTLNLSQRQALEQFLQSPRRLMLLQGPPGSGKSATILVLLRAIIDGGLVREGEVILVSGPTNKAVHHLAEQTLSEVAAATGSSAMGRMRLALAGVAERLPELRAEQLSSGAAATMLRDIYVHGAQEAATVRLQRALQQLEQGDAGGAVSALAFVAQSLARRAPKTCAPADLHGLASRAGEHLRSKSVQGLRKILQQAQERVADLPPEGVEREMLSNCHILFGTLATVGRASLRKHVGRTVRWAIVDEAAQPTEAETLLLLGWDPQKALLVGDPQQLSATVVSRPGHECGYERSLMGRLLEGGQPFRMLQEQYRMHPEISRFPAAHFYGGRLRDAEQIAGLSPARGLHLWDGTVSALPQYLVVDVRVGCESGGGHGNGSYSNEKEALLAVHLAEVLASAAACRGRADAGRGGNGLICLLTFYQGQAKRLQRELDSRALACPALRALCREGRVAVHSVDSFQGSEAETVILSCVRTGGLGFLKDDRRLNVALTRAQRQLVVLANVPGLRHATSERGGRQPALLEMLADASQRRLVLRARSLRMHLTHEDSPGLWRRISRSVLVKAGGTLHFKLLRRRAARAHPLARVGKRRVAKRRLFGVKALACLPEEWLSREDALVRLPLQGEA